MIGGIVEVADAGRHLSVHRGFLKVDEEGAELGRVPLDDITALILSGPQVTLTKALLVALAERKAVVVTCGRNYHPLSMTLPFGAHFEVAGILEDQIAASGPLKKRLWQGLVKAKVANQRAVLEARVPDSAKIAELTVLERRVKSGDPENMEAQAARHYWPALMGPDFRRERAGGGGNGLLNYVYTVLRAAMARAVVAAGLHPSLGLHHGSRVNAFALVDDLMEPFRPMGDALACRELDGAGGEEPDLVPEVKRRLARVLQTDMMLDETLSPVANAQVRLAQSLAQSFRDGTPALAIARVRPPGRLL